MTEPPRLVRVTATLTRAPNLPNGDARVGLEIEACLDARGHIDANCVPLTAWRVRRYWPDREDWRGELVPIDDGWGIRGADGDDEPVWELQGGVLRPGEYITLIRSTDAESVFRIVNVEPV